jgi:hypothetical protein
MTLQKIAELIEKRREAIAELQSAPASQEALQRLQALLAEGEDAAATLRIVRREIVVGQARLSALRSSLAASFERPRPSVELRG